MIKKYLIKILLSSGLIILALLSVVSAIFLIFHGKTAVNAPEASTLSPLPSAKQLILYSVSGKIKSIDSNKIQLETLTADSIVKPLSEKKLEIRELTIGDDTKITRLIFIPRKEGVKIPENPTVDSFGSLSSFSAEYAAATIHNLKIDDNISADYSSDLTEIKNFIPKTITILPYAVY